MSVRDSSREYRLRSCRPWQKVALVDADIGLRNLDIVLGLENRIVFDIIHAMEGRCRLRQALIRDKRVQTLFFCLQLSPKIRMLLCLSK